MTRGSRLEPNHGNRGGGSVWRRHRRRCRREVGLATAATAAADTAAAAADADTDTTTPIPVPVLTKITTRLVTWLGRSMTSDGLVALTRVGLAASLSGLLIRPHVGSVAISLLIFYWFRRIGGQFINLQVPSM